MFTDVESFPETIFKSRRTDIRRMRTIQKLINLKSMPHHYGVTMARSVHVVAFLRVGEPFALAGRSHRQQVHRFSLSRAGKMAGQASRITPASLFLGTVRRNADADWQINGGRFSEKAAARRKKYGVRRRTGWRMFFSNNEAPDN